jgi:FHS family L-fucose permease-like MFS transporter
MIPLIFPKATTHKVLFLFAIGALVCVAIAGFGTAAGAWALVAAGFFHSIMWGNIFALSLRDLGSFTSKGSGLLVMAIVGGAILPPIQGLLADSVGRPPSYWMLLPAYLYLIWFARSGHRIKPKFS